MLLKVSTDLHLYYMRHYDHMHAQHNIARAWIRQAAALGQAERKHVASSHSGRSKMRACWAPSAHTARYHLAKDMALPPLTSLNMQCKPWLT